jgi:maltokinase
MIDEAALEKLLTEHLPAQRWFGARGVAGIDTVRVLRSERPSLLQVVVRGDDGDRYQTVIGLRDTGDTPAFFEGKASAMIGELDTPDGPVVAYDATIDPDLSIALLHEVLPDTEVTKARPLGAEQSNTSLVFDERLVLKVFRRLPVGANPDAEVTRALADIGFEHVIPPVGEWRDEHGDYGIVNELLVGAVDGWHLALTSLRDLYDRRWPPDQAPGDFGFDAGRLGRVTAELHVAMADAFGVHEADVDTWIDDMESQLARVDLPSKTAKAARSVYQALRDVEVGPAIRIHGDYHLGQTLSTDLGWFVLDFEGEPARPIDERRRPSSPMRDVAGMVRSFGYAPQAALREVGGTEDEELKRLAGAWEQHNAECFLAGYEGYGEVDRVLPPTEARHVVRRAFELDKAVYEVGYELGHRPDWVEIPMAAVTRLLEVG